MPEFTVRRVNDLRPAIENIVDALIDDMLARGPGAAHRMASRSAGFHLAEPGSPAA